MYESTEWSDIEAWMTATYPTTDDSEEKKDFLNNLQEECKASETDMEVPKQILEIVSSVMQDELKQVEVVETCLGTIHAWRRATQKQKDAENLQLSSGFYINLNAVPEAILFWKHLCEHEVFARRNAASRQSLDTEYKKFSKDKIPSHKFAEVLFCLSWFDVLRVVGNNSVVFNQRRTLYF